MTKYFREERDRAERRHTIFGWIVFAVVLVILILVLGPCDPPPGEPVPASHGGPSQGLPVTDLRTLPDLPPETSGECTGETLGSTSTGG